MGATLLVWLLLRYLAFGIFVEYVEAPPAINCGRELLMNKVFKPPCAGRRGAPRA